MAEAARAWGVFVVSWAFDSEFEGGSPHASDHAKVPGATKTTTARFYEDRDGDDVIDVIDAGEGVRAKATLVDWYTGRT